MIYLLIKSDPLILAQHWRAIIGQPGPPLEVQQEAAQAIDGFMAEWAGNLEQSIRAYDAEHPAEKFTKADSGYIGVDFDGTLVERAEWPAIGAPVPEMVERVKQWLADGEQVRILTARASTDLNGREQRQMIESWCLEHLGQVLPVTNVKDHDMIELWDDRAVRVEPDTGEPLSPSEKVEKAFNNFLAKASKKTKDAQRRLEDKLKVHLKKLGDELADKVRGLEPKAEKASKDDSKKKRILSWVDSLDWTPLIPDAEGDLTTVLQDASGKALADLKITDKDLISSNNTVAAGYAKDRAAEMVGKKWVKGKLVENPNPKYAISNTTRDNLRDLVTKAFEKDTPLSELAQSIQDSENFSPYRAKMIAFTEAKRAEGQGSLLGWKTSGAVWGVNWDTSEDHDDDSDCDCSDNADGSPWDLSEVPEYPSHPNCWCVLSPALIADMEKAARDRLAKLEAIGNALSAHENKLIERF